MSAARPPGEEQRRYTLDEAAPATLLPLSNGLDAMTGQEVRTAFYSLPIPSDDGRDTLVLLPGNFTAFSTSNDYATARRWYEEAGLQAPPATRDGIAWLPPAPYYMPAVPGIGMPCLYDTDSMVAWALAPARDPAIRRHLPTYEGRSPHFFLGPPMTPFPPSAELEAEVESYYPRGMSQIRDYQEGVARALETGDLPIRRGGDGQQAALASAASARGTRAPATNAAGGVGAAGPNEPQPAAQQRASASSSSAAAPPTSATSAGRNATSSSAQSNVSTTAPSSRTGVRPIGIQRGFLNRATRTRPAGAQTAVETAEASTPNANNAVPAIVRHTQAANSSPAAPPTSTATSSTSAGPVEQQQRNETQDQQPLAGGEQPRWTRPDLPRARLLSTQVDPRTGEVLRASFYSLPLTASDGQQMLAVMPSEYYPFTSPEIYTEACRYYSSAAIRSPPYYRDGEAWVPGSPHYVAPPEGADRPATLYDNDSLISWPLIDVAQRPDLLADLPPYEGRQAHFVLGRPTVPFSTSGAEQSSRTASQQRSSASQHQVSSGGDDYGGSEDLVWATLLSPEEVNRGGAPVSSFYYRLPFAAADGRRALVIMPVESVPFPTPEDHATARPYYVNAGYRPPPYMRDGRPYVPLAPIFMPPQRSEGLQIPSFYDAAASFTWRLIKIGGPDPLASLPWWDRNDPLQADYIVAPIGSSIPHFADADIGVALPVTQQYERTATFPPADPRAPLSALFAPALTTLASAHATEPQQRAPGNLNRSQRRQRERQAQQQGDQQQRGQQPGQQQPGNGQQRQPAPSLTTRCRATILDENDNTQAEVASGVDFPTTYYTLPFTASDGRQTLIAMPGESLPLHEAVRMPNGREAFFLPTEPVYIPAEMSPDNIPILRAERVNLTWPLISTADPNAPTLNPWQRIRRPHFITGRYVRDGESARNGLHGDGNEENLTARIKRFVDDLDTADAELRLRMARLGIGEIGDAAAGEAGLGCAVCIEAFDVDDKPEWVTAEAHDQHVVITPCGGFHAFHRGCLRQALESVKSWRKWACPMCRSPLRDAAAKRVEELEGRNGAGTATASPVGNVKSQKTTQKSLRDEIRRREKERGYLCDYPACYPTYDTEPSTAAKMAEAKDDGDDNGDDNGDDADARLEAELDRRLITLKPCGHQVHRECLTTVLRVEDRHALEIEAEECEEDEEQESDAEDGITNGMASAGLGDAKGRSACRSPSPAIREVGRWVKCPIDKADVWAMIPVVKKGRSMAAKQEEASSSGSGEGSSGKDEGAVVADEGTAQDEKQTQGKKEGKGKGKF